MNALEAATVNFASIESILQPILDQFSVQNITTFISGVIGIGVPFIFLWWGVKKLYRTILKVATRGKLSV